MTDREAARQQIAELVEKYRHLTESQKRGYSEEDVKKDFLLPLFEALGWDTANTQRRNEVRAEEKIAEGFPDYSFRLNGVPVFYLEAKKFSVNIGDDKPMKQAINYSYLKGVTWAVLSDFEGLMVFNADWEERDPIKARMLDLHWQHYADSDFDDLWLLSREAIEAGEIDRTAERFGRKKKRDDVNKVLFADLTQWRHDLFKEITQMGTTLWSRDYAMVDEAIQRFLDRLIFIRTVEDRRIEENRLRAALRQYTTSKNKNKNLFAELLKLFRELDGIYNARLFAQHRLDTDLEIHDVNLLTTIINGLYDVKGGFANYDFAAIDADVLGAVYEQYLSFKAQDPQGQDALDLSKRSKRKAQGIYYTPKYVVRYIVQQTLGKLLDAPDMTAERAHNLRILDPACGSGSFLIEAFQVLDRWLAQHGDDTDRTDRRKRRMRILQENLYGVDLDPQAVEVAQLNLLLQAAHEREKLMLLPHIQQGNSLISDPAVAGSDAFIWEERFPEVMVAGGFDVVIGNPPYIRPHRISDVHKNYFWANYVAFKAKSDIYVCFMERGLSLLNLGGKFGFIVSNGFLRLDSFEALRKHLLEIASLERLVDFEDYVFEDASIKTAIVIATKGIEANHLVNVVTTQANGNLESLNYRQIEQAVFHGTYKAIFDISITDDLEHIKDKMRQFVQLEEEFNISFGLKTGDDSKFLSFDRTDENHKPLLRGENISRYMTEFAGEFVWFVPEAMRLHRSTARPGTSERFEQPKVLVRDTSDTLQATYDDKNYYVKDVLVVSFQDYRPEYLKFLTGLLNSRLMRFYYETSFPTLHVQRDELASLPIRTINFDDPADKKRHDDMVGMVERMLKLKADHAQAEANYDDRRHDLAHQIERLDKQIDALVYELYGLTADEIAIVEGSAS